MGTRRRLRPRAGRAREAPPAPLVIAPPGTRWAHIIGLGAVAGIGFTVSLFIAGLALEPGPLQDDAKVGVLVASVIAAVLATLVFTVAARRPATDSDG
ncbi:MAG TPA: Na+/H+ antiporter NhaA [Ilumatobacter sp.]|nr:Na+/H+ antiporter NhaA [Ilumatobacter sp.]